MLPEHFRSAKDIVEEQLHTIDTEIARIDEEIQAKEAELATINQRKAAFIQIKDNLLSDKGKLEAVPK